MKYPLITKCELLSLLLMLMSAYGFAQTKQFPVILDTFSQRPQLKIYTKLNLWEKRVQYIGPVIDTITIKHIIDPYEVIKNHSVYPEGEDTLMSKITLIVSMENWIYRLTPKNMYRWKKQIGPAQRKWFTIINLTRSS